MNNISARAKMIYDFRPKANNLINSIKKSNALLKTISAKKFSDPQEKEKFDLIVANEIKEIYHEFLCPLKNSLFSLKDAKGKLIFPQQTLTKIADLVDLVKFIYQPFEDQNDPQAQQKSIRQIALINPLINEVVKEVNDKTSILSICFTLIGDFLTQVLQNLAQKVGVNIKKDQPLVFLPENSKLIKLKDQFLVADFTGIYNPHRENLIDKYPNFVNKGNSRGR